MSALGGLLGLQGLDVQVGKIEKLKISLSIRLIAFWLFTVYDKQATTSGSSDGGV